MSVSEKTKQFIKRFAADMGYSLVSLLVLNMVLSLGVYPRLRAELGADENGRMLFYTAIMGLMASAFGSGINYGRMKASTLHETKNGDYNLMLLGVAAVSIIITLVGFMFKPDAAGATIPGVAVLIFATVVRYYSDVEYRLSLNYKGFFFYYMLISAGYVVGLFLYRFTQSWVTIFLTGELFGIAFVGVTGSIYRPLSFKRSESFKEDARISASLSSAYLLSDFVSYTDRIVLAMLVSDSASTYLYIASLVGKMTSLISTPLNGVITGHLSRYNARVTKRMFTRIFLALLAFAIVLIAGTTVGSHIFVYLFYRQDYDIVRPLFLMANAGQVFFFLSNTMMTVVLRFAPAKYQMIMGIVYAAVFVAGVLPAMYFFGIWGAVWGLLGINVMKLLLITALGYVALRKEEEGAVSARDDENE